MSTLKGLVGIEGGVIADCASFYTVSNGIAALRLHRAITTADDNGAIVIYKDDDGTYRCERYRFLISQDESLLKSRTAVRQWLKEQLPKIR